MKTHLCIALVTLTALRATLWSTAAHAHALDSEFDCTSSPHTFITSLQDGQFIDSKPMRVEKNSVNAFRPTHGSDLTVFGFHVYAVLGYERDDTLFRKGSGDAIAVPLYGAVVSGPVETVETRARQAGSDAVVRQVIPMLLTAIVCNEHQVGQSPHETSETR
ncbi:hypothetical protein [Paraburkholderia sp. SIMBA_030]|uniref:hypothetical protein n=1 Tax=Paraburkholderia sp. SIMBA_030 TaxID=3085773 RepID=UPI00397DCC08